MRRTVPTLAFLIAMLAAPAGASALPPFGGLTQLGETSGCIKYNGSDGCATDAVLAGLGDIATSPDGRNVYTTQVTTSSVAAFARDPVSGAITSRVNCVNSDGSNGCANIGAKLNFAYAVDVSPDGRNVYVVGYLSQTIITFARDQNNGALTMTDCDSSVAVPGCTTGTPGALNGADGVDVSPDGKSVYAVSNGDNAIVRYNRDATSGALNEVWCFRQTGGGGCATAAALSNPVDVEVSPDNKNVYVASNSLPGVAVFDRDPTAGSITVPAGTAACISDGGSPCAQGHGMTTPYKISISPDSQNLYVAAFNPGKIAITSRGSTGALSQAAGTTGAATFANASSVLVSPDGKSVYAGSGYNGLPVATQDAIAIFDRASDGTLAQLAPPNGCIDTAGGGCTAGRALDDVIALAVPPQGNSLYSAAYSSSAIGVYARELPPVCTNPPLQTFRNDLGGDVPLPCTDPNGDAVVSRSISTPPAHGTVTVNNATTRASYAPKSHYYGADSFQFVGSDGSTTSDPATAQVSLSDRIAPFVTLGKNRLKLNRAGKVAVKVGCPKGEQDGCPNGKLTIGSSKRINITLHKKRKAKLSLGSTKFSLKAGQTKKIRVKLTRTARRVVRHLRDVRVNLTATVRDPNGNTGKTTQATHVKR